MSSIPNFAKVPLQPTVSSPPAARPAAPEAPAWETPEGIPVKPVFTDADTAGLDFIDTMPGIAPFVRGPYPAMYALQPWTIRQYAGFSTAEDRTPSIAAISPRDRRASRSPSIWQPTAATIPTTRGSKATWAWPV